MIKKQKASTGEIPVHCAFDELADPTALTPNAHNPNRHSAEQIELLAKIIENQGWRAPITVSNRSRMVVRGHGRLQAALLLGCTKVPVDCQDYATEAEELADLIADNRLSELSVMDQRGLKDLLQGLDDETFDLTLTGFDDDELHKLMEWTPDVAPVEEVEPREPKQVLCECPKCGFRWAP